MEVKRLDWDSAFFGLEVFGAQVGRGANIREMTRALQSSGADLVYIFLQEPDADLDKQLTASGAILYDEKITYGKELTHLSHTDHSRTTREGISESLEVYEGPLTDDLLRLAIMAGHESRFRKDPRLSDHFEPLYKLWMTNSLNGSFADKVFVFKAEDGIKGMASCKIRGDQMGSIGLIATDAGFQGKGVGKSLVQAIDFYYQDNNVKTSTVVTQKSNIQACNFYEKAGFTVYKLEHVYHLWFK